MAKKSKTQRAKASAARAARKEARQAEAAAEALKQAQGESADTEAPKKKLFGKSSQADGSAKDAKQGKAVEKKAEKKAPKPKKRFQFFKDVKAEMKRVTWPSRQDVLRWSVVVVAALLFFGIYVAVLDNGIITPLLFLISGVGA